MSTRILDAYRLPEGTTPFQWIGPLREKILPVRYRLDAEWVYTTAVQQLDKAVLGIQAPEFGDTNIPLVDVASVINAEQRLLKKTDYGYDPHRFEACFFEDQDGRHYTILYFDHSAIREAVAEFTADNGWDDFHYQNSVDRPSHITESEWYGRLSVWDRLMPDSVAAHSCLTLAVEPQNFGEVMGSIFGLYQDEKDALCALTPVAQSRRLAQLMHAARESVSNKLSGKQQALLDNMFEYSLTINKATNLYTANSDQLGRMQEIAPGDLLDMFEHPVTHDFSNEELCEMRKQAVIEYLNGDHEVSDVVRDLLLTIHVR